MKTLLSALFAAIALVSCKPKTATTEAAGSDATNDPTTAPADQAASPIASAAPGTNGSFEGEIELTTYPYSVVTEVKGDRSRTMFLSHGSPTDGNLIVDRKTNTLFTVFSHGSQYTVTDLATVKPKVALVAVST